MEIEFEQILVLLEKLNNNNDKAAIFAPNLLDEYENIKDLHLLNKNTMSSISQLKEINHLSTDEIMEQICYLNTYLNSYIWHTESMRDIVQKFIYYERFKI
jgi:hypothetical protein